MDEADRADAADAPILDAGVQDIRRKAAEMVPGEPGECTECGEWRGRLVSGVCAPCRDLLLYTRRSYR